MEGVGGVILDESVVLACDGESGNASVRPAAEYLLRKLRYSTIPTGISFRSNLSDDKVTLLKRLAALHSSCCFIFDASSIDSDLHEIPSALGDTGGSILYIVSENEKNNFLKLSNRGWRIIVPRSVVHGSTEDVESGRISVNGDLIYIDELQELLLTICRLSKKASRHTFVTVGYTMKPSREEDFAKRGALPMRPTENGLFFLPLVLESPISSQFEEVDMILHKATDEIVSIEMASCLEYNRITFTRGMHELERHMEHYPGCCVIDPLKNIYPVLDRLRIQEILYGLDGLCTKGQKTIRGPHFLKVDNFNDSKLAQRLSDAKLSLPNIVKPQIACGVADAHSMAIIFRFEDYKDLPVPLPAVIQEYVDHSSTIYKFYVLGKQIFHTAKTSMPNASTLIKLSERNGLRPLLFDSLKCLPIDKQNQTSGDAFCTRSRNQQIDLDLVTDAADWLRQRLDLTIFGFDVVIQEGSGDHVIVDVNYLPSFKEVPDGEAIPAFWNAIKGRFESMRKVSISED